MTNILMQKILTEMTKKIGGYSNAQRQIFLYCTIHL
jgi:hypothetical protein